MNSLVKFPIARLASLAHPAKGSMAGGPFGSDLVSRDYVSFGVPVVRGTNLPKDSKFSLDNCVFVSEGKADALHLNCAHPGDLVFTQRGTLGQVGLIPYDTPYSRFLISQSQMKMVVDRTKAEPLYIYNYFRLPSTVTYIENHALQAGVPHINLGILRRLEIFAPPLATQKKIAAILSAYDDLIANNQRRITLLERMAEDIYREWFVRLRFPGHKQAKMEKGLPKGWKQSTLGAIADFTMGQSPSSEYFNESGNGLPFHQGVGSYGPRYPNHDTFCSVAGRKAKPNDILFSVRAPVGRLNIADRELIIGRGLAAIRHKSGLNGYLLYLLKVVFASEDIIGNGSIFNSVGKDELARLAVFEPALELVEKFEAIVRPVDRQIATLYRVNAGLKATRDALLPRLISGKLAVDALAIRFPPSFGDAIAPK
jgi:type I restriction enzyme, S subunit